MVIDMNYNNFIGVDPDLEKSGVAYLEKSTRKLEVCTLSFPDLLDYLKAVKEKSDELGEPVIVVVEAGWLNKGNWHLLSKDSRAVSAAKGNHTGRNHEVGRKIVEMCKHYGLEVVEKRPLRKIWKGKEGKITHKELSSFTGITGRTNQEGRDAALIAWDYAGLPIRIKSK